jgi:hypothetical protein
MRAVAAGQGLAQGARSRVPFALRPLRRGSGVGRAVHRAGRVEQQPEALGASRREQGEVREGERHGAVSVPTG